MSKTKIEWADKTWNPITGCTKVSLGCNNCYAERMAQRLQAMGQLGYKNGFNVTNQDDTVFIQPMKWRKPSRIFVCSMGDLFHEDVNVRWIDGVFGSMGLTYDCTGEMIKNESGGQSAIQKQRHTYLILTKRPERMKEYILELIAADWDTLRKRFYNYAMAACNIHYKAAYLNHMNASMSVATWIKKGMPGLWLGVTAENQEQADKRIPILLQIPAAMRFVSVEPMLSMVNIKQYLPHNPRLFSERNGYKNFLNWVICGGESGPGARPVHPDWVRSLRDQCKSAGVPFMFKQWGELLPASQVNDDNRLFFNPSVKVYENNICDALANRDFWGKVSKKKAGRMLDGVLWDQYPNCGAGNG